MNELSFFRFEESGLLTRETIAAHPPLTGYARPVSLARLPARFMTKRVFDAVAALGLLLVLAPLMVFIALAVKSDGGPVFYRHRRIGLGGRSFGCMKFRTMVTDADARLAALLADDPAARAEWAATQKLKSDPRVTRIGRFLRQWSFDELPQLFNVLAGSMSLVGPRPVVQSEVAHYGDRIRYYLACRPGLTGLWQVSGRSDTTYGERVRLDQRYAQSWSIALDIRILLATVTTVAKRAGAY